MLDVFIQHMPTVKSLPFSETNECAFLSSVIQAIRRPWMEESEALLWHISSMTDEIFYLSEHKVLFTALKDTLFSNCKLGKLSDTMMEVEQNGLRYRTWQNAVDVMRVYLEERLQNNHFDQLLCNEVLDKVFSYVDCPDGWQDYLESMTKYHRRRLMISECLQKQNQMFDLRIEIPDGPMSITV